MKISNNFAFLCKIVGIAFLIVIAFAAFTGSSKAQTKPITDKVLKDTVIKSMTYKLYAGSRGGKYIMVTSKTGKLYKRYFKG